MLIEAKIFDKIEVNFLIVGHTHSTIDQYFSVLSNAIKQSNFIASPISLANLFMTTHSDIKKRPEFVKQILVYYDYKAFFKKYLNDKISVSNLNILNIIKIIIIIN
jgi:hypothetical protein